MGGKPAYENPLTTRYGSEEMRSLFSPDHRVRIWRDLWIALARAESRLGLPVTAEQVAEMEAARDRIDYEAVAAKEAEIRHDVMAHVHAFGLECPGAKGVIHLGATSCFVTDNADLIVIREALGRIRTLAVNVLAKLAEFARRHRDLPALGYTHFQTAQPVTVGKRACLWAQDVLLDLERVDFEIDALRFRGVKGTTGTQASFLELFSGDESRVQELERLVAEEMGFSGVYPVTGQTYPRKADYSVLSVLSGVGQSAHKFANDVRLLMHLDEVEEPFESGQVGSSAMPYKRNPMRTERMTAISRYLLSLPANAAQTAAEQWLERTLDDSANRRIVIPEAFLAADAILTLWLNVAAGLRVNEKVVRRNLERELPFFATEGFLMRAVKAGGDRQVLHERIRVHSVAAKEAIRAGAERNDLLERLAGDAAFAAVQEDLASPLRADDYVGRAPAQVDAFLSEHVEPRLERHREDLGIEGRIHV